MVLWDSEKRQGKLKKLDRVSVWELMDNNFYIPDYQRGYRWTEKEVTKLLEDFVEYYENWKSGDSFYCMQPLVVFYNKNKNAWEVIDGQQRLTTLFLILKQYEEYINVKFKIEKAKLFKLSYESRSKSETFLESDIKKYIELLIERDECKENDKDELAKKFPLINENIDYFHICNASKTISDFFIKNPNPAKKSITDFIDNILNIKIDKDDRTKPQIQYIWFDVTDEITQQGSQISSEEIFSRLNVGKISLTNAELIKALFLNQVDRELMDVKEFGDKERISTQLKTKISTEWDMIEHNLLDGEFWSFIYGEDDGKYETRIEFLFDQIKNKSDKNKDDDYFTFDKYCSDFKDFDNDMDKLDNSVSSKWKEVTDLFYTYKNWFENRTLYHLIGYLRYKDVEIDTIRKIQENEKTLSNSDFVHKLRKLAVRYALSDKPEEDLPKYLYDEEDDWKESWIKSEEAKNFILDENIDPNKKEEYLNIKKDIVYLEYFKRNEVEEPLKNISYTETPDEKIRSILLLSNVLTALDCKKENVRFSFNNYYQTKKEKGWDIEHIHCQTDKDLSNKDSKRYKSDRLAWILTNICYFSGVEYPFEKKMDKSEEKKERDKLIEAVDDPTKRQELQGKEIVPSREDLKTQSVIKAITADDIVQDLKILISNDEIVINTPVYKTIMRDFIKEDKTIFGEEHAISNLVLLDAATNRGYQNAYFPVKRRWINKKEREGVYILPCTKNVFAKNYSTQLSDLMNWTKYDSEKYFEEIVACLSNI